MKPKVFVIMPFDSEFDPIFTDLISPPLNDAGYDVERADSNFDHQNILSDIVRGIASANLIVAEITIPNPNVFYELGLSHGLGIPTILLTQTMDHVPFDLRSYRIISYSTQFNEIGKITSELEEIGIKHQKGEITFGSPVSDFLPKDFKSTKSISMEKNSNDIVAVKKPKEPKLDKGFLDFIVEGNQATDLMTKILVNITEETEDIGNKIKVHTTRINNLSNNPGPGYASQAHKITSSAARNMNKYSGHIEEHIPKLESSIDLLVESYSGYIDWYEPNNENISEVKKFRKSVSGLLTSTRETLTNTRGFRDATSGLAGISREMNQSSERMAINLGKIVSAMEKVESFSVRILSLIDDKLEGWE